MIAGFLVLGVAAGMVSGGSALVAGYPLWLAALAYVAGGTVGLGLGAAAVLAQDDRPLRLGE